VGFLVSAAVIYVTQFIVPALRVTLLGALIAAFIIGLIDMFIPTHFAIDVSIRSVAGLNSDNLDSPPVPDGEFAFHPEHSISVIFALCIPRICFFPFYKQLSLA